MKVLGVCVYAGRESGVQHTTQTHVCEMLTCVHVLACVCPCSHAVRTQLSDMLRQRVCFKQRPQDVLRTGAKELSSSTHARKFKSAVTKRGEGMNDPMRMFMNPTLLT